MWKLYGIQMSMSKNKALFEETHATPIRLHRAWYNGRVERWWHRLNDPENLKYLLFGPFRRKFAGVCSRGEDHSHPGCHNLAIMHDS